MGTAIRVMIADDHPIVRDGLKMILEQQADDIEVAAEAANGREVLDHPQLRYVDVFILDITMPELNGLETARRLLKRDPAAKIVILSLHGGKAMVEQAIKSGVKGYLLKDSATTDVITAVRQVFEGNYYLTPSIAHFVVGGFLERQTQDELDARYQRLTPREREILQLIAEGCSTKEVAIRLDLSLNTVRVHRRNLMVKLDIHKATDLVRYALKAGIAKL